MKCKHVQQYLLDYSEELLDQKTRFLVDEHLSKCAECTKELQEIEQTIHLLQSLPVQEPPETFWPDFTSNVMREVRKLDAVPVEKRSFFFFPKVRIAMAVAVLILVISGLALYFSGAFQKLWHPAELTAQRSGVQHVEERVASQDSESEKELNEILDKFASDELMDDILNSDFALFEGDGGMTLGAGHSDDEWLEFLINSLTDEEKDQFLLELYKMK